MPKKKIIVGVSGASGSWIALDLMTELRFNSAIETHLVVSSGARRTWELEMGTPIDELLDLADFVYDEHDMAAVISSGSYHTDGMIIAPCSMKTLSAVANGYADNLIARAADVCLKEGRRVVLVPREMPLGRIHLKNMLAAQELGCAIVPPMLTFYNGPISIEDEIAHVIGKALLQLGITPSKFSAWQGASGEDAT
jgi:4-hydroxy-3-polyprenylbenzoate decarboxylase